MMGRLLILLALLLVSACSAMPPREAMLTSACADHPCREAATIELTNSQGITQAFRIPAGPVFAGGLLSVMSGERQGLALDTDENGRYTLEWLPRSQHDQADLVLGLEQRRENGETVSRLGIRNRLNAPLKLTLEQYPVNRDRFYPLPVPIVPPGKTVYRDWPHTILEVQLTGIRQVPRLRSEGSP